MIKREINEEDIAIILRMSVKRIRCIVWMMEKRECYRTYSDSIKDNIQMEINIYRNKYTKSDEILLVNLQLVTQKIYEKMKGLV